MFALLAAVVAVVLLLQSTAVCGAEPAPKLDIYGDPLPPGAVARLGSIRLRHSAPCRCAFYPGSDKLFSWGSNEDMVRIWEVPGGKLLRTITRERSAARTAVLSSDGKQLVVAWLAVVDDSLHSIFSRYDAQSLRLLKETDAGPTEGLHLIRPWLCHEDQWLLAYQPEVGVVVRDLETGRVVRRFKAAEEKFDYCPATGTLLLREREESKQHVRLVDVESGEERNRWRVDPVMFFLLSGDGRRVVVGYGGVSPAAPDDPFAPVIGRRTPRPARVQVFSASTGEPQAPAKEHQGLGGQAMLFPGSSKMLVWGRQGASIWDVASGRAVEPSITLNAAPARSHRKLQAISPDGRWVATTVRSRIEIWDRRTWTRSIEGHAADIISHMAVSPDSRLAVTRAGNEVQVWEIPSGKPLARYATHPLRIGVTEFSPDGKHLVLVEERENRADFSGIPLSERPPVLRIHDVLTGEVVREFPLPPDVNYGFAVSPVDPTAALGTVGAVLLLDLETGRVRTTLQLGRGVTPGQPTFSPQGETLICDASQTLRVWDVQSGIKLYQLRGGRVTPKTPLAFSPTGNLWLPLAERNPDQSATLTIYETATGLPARRIVVSRTGAQETFAPCADTIVATTPPKNLGLPIRREFSCMFWDIRSAVAEGNAYQSWDGRWMCDSTLDGNYVFTMNYWGGHQEVTVWKTPSEIRPDLDEGRELSRNELQRNWTKLHGEPSEALDAFFALIAGGDSTVAFLNEQLAPAKPHDHAKIERLITALDSDEFADREAAERELLAIIPQGKDQLQRALEDGGSLEFRSRAERILNSQPDVLSQNRRQIASIRAIHVLLAINSDAGQELLERLAGGSKQSRTTIYAKRAIDKLRTLTRRN